MVGSYWIPGGLSIWQFKAGRNITSADILEEVNKPGVRQGLADGGTYCLVVSADFIPARIGEMKRWLEDAVAQVQPGAPQRLVHASYIAKWATEHPSMLFSFNRPIYGICSVESWLKRHPMYQIPFQEDERRPAILKNVRLRFASDDGPVHVRLQGPSGVGKTRLALELFRNTPEEPGMALYALEPPGRDFFYWMASYPDTAATLVVDECPPAEAARLSALAEMSEHRLRLVTVGPAERLGSDEDVYAVPLLKDAVVSSVVEATTSTLSPEQVRWIVRAVKGYVKLAVVLAGKVARGLTTAFDLTTTYEVGRFLRELLPDERSRRALLGLALLTRVGWDEDVSTEGEALAHFIGMPWAEMREAIGQASRDGLVSKQGRYRYVTPELLALWLAADKWQSRGQDILDLLDTLPTPESRNALLERLVQLAGLKEASQIIEGFLSPTGLFDDLAKLNDEHIARLFSVLAKGHALAALETLERAIAPATYDQLLNFTQGRRYIVRILVRLARRKETFPRAARLLLRLAEADNEEWSDNIADMWAGLFFTFNAIEVPALERFPLLQEALQSDSPATRTLAVGALAKALSVSGTGTIADEPRNGYVPPGRWWPETWEEVHATFRAALHLLDQALHDAENQVRSKARETLFSVARGLVTTGLAEEVSALFEQLEVSNDEQCRSAWETIQSILRFEETALTEEQKKRLKERAEHFLGNSLHDRIRRYVGRPTIIDTLNTTHLPEDQRPPAVVARLADEAIREPDMLRAELSWLMSREAENAWHFGRRMGLRDETHGWLNELVGVAKTSQDSLLLSAYLQGRVDAGEEAWREQLLDGWMQEESSTALVFDAICTTEANVRAVERLTTLVERGWLAPGTLSRLVYGGWILPLAASEVRVLLERLARDTSPAASEAGLALLTQWVEKQGQEIPEILLPVAWMLVERSAGDSKPMLHYYWRQVGQVLLQHDAVRIARAVLRGVATGHIAFVDERFNILREAFALKREEIWAICADQLLEYEGLSYGLREWFRGNSVLDDLDAELLLGWARQEPERRPQLLARLIKPKETITPIVRGVLREYGPASFPADILAGNFASGAWMGSWSQHEAQQLEIIKGWLGDPESNVRTWAQRMAISAQQLLPHLMRMEEEELNM